MLKRLAMVVTCFFAPMIGSAFCESCHPKEKIYVQLEDLIFDNQGIWFKHSEGPFVRGVQSLHVDSYGYYFAKDQQTWKCAHCGTINQGPYPGFWGCSRCGFPYD